MQIKHCKHFYTRSYVIIEQHKKKDCNIIQLEIVQSLLVYQKKIS